MFSQKKIRMKELFIGIFLLQVFFCRRVCCKPASLSYKDGSVGVEQSLMRDILERAFGIDKNKKQSSVAVFKKNELGFKQSNERVRPFLKLFFSFFKGSLFKNVIHFNKFSRTSIRFESRAELPEFLVIF